MRYISLEMSAVCWGCSSDINITSCLCSGEREKHIKFLFARGAALMQILRVAHAQERERERENIKSSTSQIPTDKDQNINISLQFYFSSLSSFLHHTKITLKYN